MRTLSVIAVCCLIAYAEASAIGDNITARFNHLAAILSSPPALQK